MRYEEFIGKVQDYGGLASGDEALTLINAFLATLSQPLSRIHRHHLAAQLPGELKGEILAIERTERFLPEEFVKRVAARARVTFHAALKQSPVVMRVLREAVAPGELDDIMAELPEEYNELFKPGATPAALDAHELHPPQR